MSSDSTLASTMTLRQLKDALTSHINTLAEHKVNNGLTVVSADVKRLESDLKTVGTDLNGNGKPGIKADMAVWKQRMNTIEQNHKDGLALVERKFGELTSELREMFDTVTQPGKRRPPESEAPGKKSRRPLIDSDAVKLILVLVSTILGVGGSNFAFKELNAPETEVVTETAKAVVDKREELEKREEELRRREAWIARQIAIRRTTEPTMPEPVPHAPVPASTE